MNNQIGRTDKSVVYSSQTTELESNSITEQSSIPNEKANDFPQGDPALNETSLKNQATEMASLTSLSGQLRYRSLMQQLNTTTVLAYQTGQQPPNLQPTPTTPSGVPGSSPQGDALGQAAASGDLKKVKEMLAAGVDINLPNSKTGMTPLMQAAQSGKLDVMKLLLAQNPKPDVDAGDTEKRTAMFWAAQNGQSDALALLKQHKADPNIHANHFRYPIMEAAQRGDAKSVRILSQGGRAKENADVNKKDVNERTALMEAADFGNAETVKALLDQYPDYGAKDITGRTALMEAAKKGNAESTKLLMERIGTLQDPKIESDLINAKDEQGRTALMDASKSGNKNAVAELLKHKEIQVNLQDKQGNTALMEAAAKGNADAVQSLLAKGADPNIKDFVEDGKGEKTALMKAAEKGNSAVLQVLANSKKIDLNLKDKEGNTALKYAIASQDLKSVKALVAAGARLDITDANNKDALTIAQDIRQKATTPDAQKAADEILQVLSNPPKKP